MDQVRVAFDAKRYFHNATGLGNYARWLVDGLAAKHVQPVLAIAKPQESPFELWHPSSFLHKQLPSYWRSRGLSSELKSKKLDLFHGLSNELPFGIHRLAIPSVVTIHDLIQRRFPENYRWIDRSIYNRKVAYAQKHATAIVVPSLQTKKDLIRFYQTDESRIEVIPIGVDRSQIVHPKENGAGDYVLCVSSFTRRKNLIRLVKAFDQAELKDVPLIIAGKSGESLNRVRKLIENRPNIQLRTDLRTADLDLLYQNARFCVYPSLFEGYGIPVIEAFQHGKTIAVSKVSSLPEVAGEAALYFDPRNIDEMASSIQNLWFSEKHRQHLESKIGSELDKLDADRLLNRYIELYQRVLQP